MRFSLFGTGSHVTQLWVFLQGPFGAAVHHSGDLHQLPRKVIPYATLNDMFTF